MILRGVFIVFANFVLISGQNASVPEIFLANGIVSDVIDKAPESKLFVGFRDLDVELGNKLTPKQAGFLPATVNWTADPNAFYTLMLVDPDAPARALPLLREIVHWLVLNIPGGDWESGDVVAEYRAPGPPPFTGYHRFIFLLFKQPHKLKYNEKPIPRNSLTARLGFKTREIAKKYKLGDPIAANFFLSKFS